MPSPVKILKILGNKADKEGIKIQLFDLGANSYGRQFEVIYLQIFSDFFLLRYLITWV